MRRGQIISFPLAYCCVLSCQTRPMLVERIRTHIVFRADFLHRCIACKPIHQRYIYMMVIAMRLYSPEQAAQQIVFLGHASLSLTAVMRVLSNCLNPPLMNCSLASLRDVA